MKLTVGFSKSKLKFPIISWLIMLCEKTNFCHAYIKISTSRGKEIIYHATGSGVSFFGKTVFDKRFEPVEEYEFEIDNSIRDNFFDWCFDNSGKSYSKLQILGLGLKRLLMLLKIKIKNPFAGGQDSYVCSELVAAALNTVALENFENLDDIDLVALRQEVINLHSKQKN